jgi:hypothetical protein
MSFGLCNLLGSVRLAAVCWEILWFPGFGAFAGDSAMANVGKFPERRAYARPRRERGVLRRLAMALSVLGTCTIPIGIWADDVLVVAIGLISIVAGVVWRLWLTLPDP